MTTSTTTDPARVREWSIELLGEGSPITFFLAPSRLVRARRTEDSLAVTLAGEGCFGLGFGPDVPIDDDWNACSIDRSVFGDRVGRLVANDRWDFLACDSSGSATDGILTVHDDERVRAFLTAHAPRSSVWPPHPEVVDWYAVVDEGEWGSIGALVRWESGRLVLASIATVENRRGRGLATRLVRGLVGEASRRGERWLGLGVASDNVAAQTAYERAGFLPRARFTHYAEA